MSKLSRYLFTAWFALVCALAIVVLGGCARQSGPVLGVALSYSGDKIVAAEVLGTAKDMAECRTEAAKALAAYPAPLGMKIGCAVIEIQ
jgi:ABC-type branched-subunit amino acid transport system permease subunit